MGHIHNQPYEFDFTVSAYIFRFSETEQRCLMLMHRHKLLSWILPVGGHIELTETPWQAMVREVKEEAGYGINELQVLQPKDRIKGLSGVVQAPAPLVINSHRFSDDHFHTDISYALVVDSIAQGSIIDNESQEFLWVNQYQLAALSEAETVLDVQQIGAFAFSFCLVNWEAVAASSFSTKNP